MLRRNKRKKTSAEKAAAKAKRTAKRIAREKAEKEMAFFRRLEKIGKIAAWLIPAALWIFFFCCGLPTTGVFRVVREIAKDSVVKNTTKKIVVNARNRRNARKIKGVA